MSDEKTNSFAEKIARLLQNETPAFDLNSLQSSIERINARLETIEKKLETQNSDNFHSSAFVLQQNRIHPSQEKFEIPEAVDNQMFGQFETEKPCIFEPNGKPCDHCSMCDSRGF